ncbi:flavin monoamine oxidase family protein [Glacieibacterium megasporae]|uniref:flavin monoamine oxidase family protein n=1 Tax=Glacieibacterium megasporae TaxID=2835787 RepID=UPI0021038FE1|nr:FAD-dependent oxidoreductase [Polymorphobacter megasporae]
MPSTSSSARCGRWRASGGCCPSRRNIAFDAVIVGAGAAGLAAARRLADGGASVVVLEAGDRVGGRAHTVIREGYALDLGCGWLHSGERNPWTAVAEAAGLTVDRSPARWDTQWRDLGFPPADQAAFGAAFAAFDEEVERRATLPDVPLADALPAAGDWAGAVDAVVGYLDGVAARAVSLHDHAAFDAAASDNNWRVREGLGTAVATLAVGLDIRRNTAVTAIAVGSDAVRVTTSAGVVEAATAIVTVSTAVLTRIAFTPELPGHLAAAGDLPLGDVGKVFLHIDGPTDFPVDGHLRGHPRALCSASHRLRPFGWPVIESYFGGPYAADLAAAGPAAAIDAMITELCGLLGSDWRARFRPLAVSGWRAEPFIGGAWSHARPGRRDARRAIVEPVAGRLFFAGEAGALDDVGTAHGAHATGVAAATAALAVLAQPALTSPEAVAQ